ASSETVGAAEHDHSIRARIIDGSVENAWRWRTASREKLCPGRRSGYGVCIAQYPSVIGAGRSESKTSPENDHAAICRIINRRASLPGLRKTARRRQLPP